MKHHSVAVALTAVFLTIVPVATTARTDPPADRPTPVVFVCNIGSPEQLDRAYGLAESIRAFAGRYRDAPVWIYGPAELTTQDPEAQSRFAAIDVVLRSVEIPEDARWYYLSGMAFAPAAAEKQAAGRAGVLVFLGSDAVVLQEPDEFILPEGVSLGYCPVMHRNISPLYCEPLDAYWRRAFAVMNVDESKIFPMVTPADGDTIRAYFNAGCLAVRPERGLLRKRADLYLDLCRDDLLRQEAEKDERRRVFTFQVALTGAFLDNLRRDEMVEFPRRHYNYPIFFNEMYGARNDFHDLTGVALMRYEQFFDNPVPGWETILKGPEDRILWLKEHFDGD